MRFRLPFAFLILSVLAVVASASTGGWTITRHVISEAKSLAESDVRAVALPDFGAFAAINEARVEEESTHRTQRVDAFLNNFVSNRGTACGYSFPAQGHLIPPEPLEALYILFHCWKTDLS
jgi:hypothetical protein